MPTTWQSMQIQGRPTSSSVATVAQWFLNNGTPLASLSELVGKTFELLAQTIVESGGEPVFDERVGEVLSRIGRKTPVSATQLRLAHADLQQQVSFAASEVERARALFDAREAHTSGDPKVESHSDPGEYDPEALRAMLRARLRMEDTGE